MIDKTNASDDVGSEVKELLQKKDFGAGLRQAREKLGMSATDVADNLLISVDIIKALENSQADALPALTFTQGYIRSYAKLLGVSADEIISDYISMAPDSKQVLTPHSVLPVQKSSNDASMKLVSFSFIVLAITVLVFWLYKTDFKISTDLSTDIAKFNPQNESYLNETYQENQDNVGLTYEQPQDLLESSDDKDVTETEEILDENNESPIVIATESELEESPLVKDSNKTVAAVDEILLSASGESWCEIQDSTGQRLFYQLLNRGQEIKLSGVAPFTVFLGNAPKVRVEINNKIVDFESLINRNSNIASIEINKNASVVSLSNR